MLKYNTVIFDMDGTILDTLADTAAAVNHMCRELGLPQRTDEEISAGMGRGIGNLVIASLPEDKKHLADEAVEIYKEYYGAHSMDNSRPYDGIIQLLKDLKAAGFKTAVVSNKSEEYTLKIIEELYEGYIDAAIGEVEGLPLKPDPAPVLKALKQLSSDISDAVYVGDTEIDMLTAKNTGIPCITCQWGLRGKELLIKEGADPELMAEKPMDVIRILREI